MQTLALQTDSRGVTALVVDGAQKLVGVATVARAADPQQQAEAIKQALPGWRGGRADVVIALGPDDVLVRRLAVPPAPPEELPTLVAMQAAREAPGEVVVADFLPPTASEEGPLSLLACWIDQPTLSHWREVANKLGGRLTTLTPRALATLTLADPGDPAALVATRSGDALDFAARVAGEVTLVRSAQVGDASDAAERELRRTTLSLPDDRPTRVLVGEPVEGHETIPWGSLAGRLGAGADSAADVRGAAGALGLALAPDAPTLNLADPRKPPVVETGRRRQALLLAATAVVLVAGAWMLYRRLADLDTRIGEQQTLIAAAEEGVEAFQPYRERVVAIDAWRQSDVTWLDEVERLGRKLRPATLDADGFPAASDIRATQFMASAIIGGDPPGGRIDLTAMARSSSTSELESRLRDTSHPVEPISTIETQVADAYRYKYDALLRVPAEVQEPDEAEPEVDTVAEQAEEADPEPDSVSGEAPADGEAAETAASEPTETEQSVEEDAA